MKRASFLVLLLILTVSCNIRSYFAPDRNLKKRIRETDIIGTWRMTSESLSQLISDGFKDDPSYTYTISLIPNGTACFSSADSIFFSRGYQYMSTTGKWVLEHDSYGGSNIRKANVLRLDLLRPKTVSYASHFCFARESGVLILWQYYGDPDSFRYIEYKKTQ